MHTRTHALALVAAILIAVLTPVSIGAQEPSPTPRLPEEGGPPGGVLGGNIFVDNDGNGVRSPGDGATGGDEIDVYSLDANGSITPGATRGTQTDERGDWQIRALPDGMYRVIWVPPSFGSEVTYPPTEHFVLSPIQPKPIPVVTRVVEIRSASRVLDIDFGISSYPPITLPPTPPPPTPTPRLPEEGGPPGGVIAGYFYIDNDGSGTRNEGDGVAGQYVTIQELTDEGAVIIAVLPADASGRYELRALRDGTYRVFWEPQITPEQLSAPIADLVPVVINPIKTVQAVVRIVEIRGANRVLDVNFAVPVLKPVGGPIALPQTGTDGGSSTTKTLLVALGLGVSLAAALALSIARRRARG